MKKFLFIFSATIINTAVFTQNSKTDSMAVKQTIDRFTHDFATGYFSNMQEYMTPDVHWINIVGMHWHNLKEVQFAHQAFASSVLKNTIGKTKELANTIRFLSDDAALAYVITRIDDPNYPPGHLAKKATRMISPPFYC